MLLSAKKMTTFTYPHWLKLVLFSLALSLLLALSACGFRLKQSHNLPFNTIYTNVEENSSFGSRLRRLLSVNAPNLHFVSTPEAAEVQLLQLAYRRHLRELSLDPNGEVEDYELHLFMEFSLLDNKGGVLMPPTTLSVIRDIPNNPDNSYAKQIEINTLFDDMELSLVDRLLRRLSAIDVQQAYERSLQADSQPDLPRSQPPASATSFE